MATAAAETKAKGPAQPAVPPQVIARGRMTQAAQVLGEVLCITLFDDERIEEGVQDIRRWGLVGTRLAMNQWLIVSNDAGSMWRLMRVGRVHATPGSGLRALVLYDVVPPKFLDLANEPIVATGDWYVRYGGSHRRWMVVNPAGAVRRDGINTEGEAKSLCHAESGNPPPL